MSKHNILFYSSHPSDQYSQEILAELAKDPLLREQFVAICVNSPGIKLPKMIVERNEVPVIIARGFNQPISGSHALNWIKEHNSGKAVGLDYGDPGKANQVSEDHGVLAAESGTTSYHQAFNSDWNQGAENDSRSINSAFSEIADLNQIETLEEKGKNNTSGLKSEINRKLRNRDMERTREMKSGFPSPQDSLHLNQLGQQPSAPNPLQYNPREFMSPAPPNPFQEPSRTSNRPMNNQMFLQQRNSQPNLPPNFPSPPQNMMVQRSSFSQLDTAFTGQSLMGTPMKNGQFHTRREQSIPNGLPGGRGHGGPFSSMVNTSSL